MKLLVTGALKKDVCFINKLIDMGHSVDYVQDERIPLREQNIDPAAYEGVICNGLFLYNDIKEFESLRYIQLTSAGYDRVPLRYINENHIVINNAKGVYSVPMAEFALCGVLQLYKQCRFFSDNQKSHVWKKHRGVLELGGSKVCILGCGSVGTECAKRFSAFGCEVIGVDLYPQDNDFFSEIIPVSLMGDAIKNSDIVVLTLPLSEETYHLIDEEKLSMMKTGAVLVNISRGGVVDTEALIRSLPRLGGAVLDVFEEEPLGENSPIWNFDNVILTPHNSFVSQKNEDRLKEVILFNLSNSKTVDTK